MCHLCLSYFLKEEMYLWRLTLLGGVEMSVFWILLITSSRWLCFVDVFYFSPPPGLIVPSFLSVFIDSFCSHLHWLLWHVQLVPYHKKTTEPILQHGYAHPNEFKATSLFLKHCIAIQCLYLLWESAMGNAIPHFTEPINLRQMTVNDRLVNPHYWCLDLKKNINAHEVQDSYSDPEQHSITDKFRRTKLRLSKTLSFLLRLGHMVFRVGVQI